MALAGTSSSLQGTVQDSFGHPVPRAILVLHAQHEVRMAKSGGEGDFSFNSLPDGFYTLEVRAHGFSDKTMESIEIPSQTERPLTITMLVSNYPYHCGDDPVFYEKAARQERTELKGLVEDNYVPMAGIKVYLFRTGDSAAVSSQQTNRKGEFEFQDLAPGKYFVHINHSSYEDHQSQNFWIGHDFQTEIKIEMVKKGWFVACQ